MVDMLAATLTLPDAPRVLHGVSLELAPPAARFSLRGRDAELLGRESGLALPGRIGDFKDGVARLGPDEWLAILTHSNSSPERGGGPPAGWWRGTGEGAPDRTEALTRLYPSTSFAGPPPRSGEELAPLSIVDVSSRSIGIIVAGPNAAELIGAGCPLDLAQMAPGRATRTLFETVEIILVRESDLRFHIEVWRSFAPWLFAALTAAAAA